MEKRKFLALMIVIAAGLALSYSFFQKFPYAIPLILFVLLPAFMNRNKRFFIIYLSLIIIQGLILSYISIFSPVYTKETLFYCYVGVFVVYILIFIYMFITWQKNSKETGQNSLIKEYWKN